MEHQSAHLPEVLTSVQHKTGIITLNRSNSLNAISLNMVRLMRRALEVWRDDPDIHQVIIESAHEKAFCAGGDIRAVYWAKQRGDYGYIDSLFREEYQLTHLIRTYPKPYISLIQGICMGGGMGVAMHGTYRVVSSSAVLAMPETTIGFFPDVGAGIFLNACPGKVGLWMGLLGERVGGADAVEIGLATHYVPWDHLATVRELLVENSGHVPQILKDYSSPAPSTIHRNRDAIDYFFGGSSPEDIIERLRTMPHPMAGLWEKTLRSKSPTGVKLCFEHMHRSKNQSDIDVFRQEYRITHRCVRGKEFEEGIRALLIHKDQSPRWAPQSFEELSQQTISGYFAPLDEEWSA